MRGRGVLEPTWNEVSDVTGQPYPALGVSRDESLGVARLQLQEALTRRPKLARQQEGVAFSAGEARGQGGRSSAGVFADASGAGGSRV